MTCATTNELKISTVDAAGNVPVLVGYLCANTVCCRKATTAPERLPAGVNVQS